MNLAEAMEIKSDNLELAEALSTLKCEYLKLKDKHLFCQHVLKCLIHLDGFIEENLGDKIEEALK